MIVIHDADDTAVHPQLPPVVTVMLLLLPVEGAATFVAESV